MPHQTRSKTRQFLQPAVHDSEDGDSSEADSETSFDNPPNLDCPIFLSKDERFEVPSGTLISDHPGRDIHLPRIYQVSTHPLLPPLVDVSKPHRILIIIVNCDPAYMKNLDAYEESLKAPEGTTESILSLGA